jgi:hypothetical protein
MQARAWGGILTIYLFSVFNTPKYVKTQEINFAGLILKH